MAVNSWVNRAIGKDGGGLCLRVWGSVSAEPFLCCKFIVYK